jgi:MSHA biogenesis protein MshM
MMTNTSSNLIRDCEAFFGLRESPFQLTPDTRYLVNLIDHNNAFNMLMYAIESGEGFMKITGEVGLGKTLICRRLLNALNEQCETLYIPNPRLTPSAIKRALAIELGINIKRVDEASLLMKINEKLVDIGKKGRRLVLLIDESQNIPSETLEEIRMISNLETEQRKLIQIVLFGQPELDEILNKRMHRQLKQRIGFSYELKPLDFNSVYTYVVSRIRFAGYQGHQPFSYWAIRSLARASMGSPRLLNILCHKALLLAYAKGQFQIKRNDIIRAAEDTESARKPLVNAHWYWIAPAALTPVVVLAARMMG